MRRAYGLYGLRLVSDIALPGARGAAAGRPTVELAEAPASTFAPAASLAAGARERWFRHLRLPDGSHYLRWRGLAQFLVAADGRRVAWGALGATRESIRTYLLGQVISFALLKHGLEPLHATAVVVEGGAIAFVGDCGYGKSTLGASFVQAGHALLTDDVLVVQETAGAFAAHAGPSRIKLFPEVARACLGANGGGVPMNRLTPKLVLALPRDGGRGGPGRAPLQAIYVLARPRRGRAAVTIRALPPGRAVIELVRGTFNLMDLEPARLERQLDLAARLAAAVPVRTLSYPRALERLPAVREAIAADLAA